MVSKPTGYYGFVLYLTEDKQSQSKEFKNNTIDDVMKVIAELYSEKALIINFNITMNK